MSTFKLRFNYKKNNIKISHIKDLVLLVHVIMF